jgi:hypothetical protein
MLDYGVDGLAVPRGGRPLDGPEWYRRPLRHRGHAALPFATLMRSPRTSCTPSMCRARPSARTRLASQAGLRCYHPPPHSGARPGKTFDVVTRLTRLGPPWTVVFGAQRGNTAPAARAGGNMVSQFQEIVSSIPCERLAAMASRTGAQRRSGKRGWRRTFGDLARRRRG